MAFAGSLLGSSKSDRSDHTDWALGHFPCQLSQARLRRTPQEDIELALSRAPRGMLRILSAVYVIANAANDLVKIGYADNLGQRMSGLNCGSPVDLELVHFVYFVDEYIAKCVEGDAHRALAEHRRKGEWFNVTLDQAGEAIAQSANARRLRWWSEAERRKLRKFMERRRERYEFRKRIFGT